MGAIRVLTRNELRRQWKRIVALTLFVGVVGAVVLASVAGAALALVPATILLVDPNAALPGRAATRTRPAVVLRSE
jgi:hypothetical protein